LELCKQHSGRNKPPKEQRKSVGTFGCECRRREFSTMEQMRAIKEKPGVKPGDSLN